MKKSINTLLLAIVLLVGFNSCQNNNKENSAPAQAVDANGYTTIDIEGTPVKKMEKYDQNNQLVESGEMLNNLKTGTWTTFHPDGRVKSVSSYLAGKLNGLMITMTDRGHLEMQAFYKDGKLNGNWITYTNGSRKKEERVYSMDKLNGINKHYDRTGKLQKEIGFKDGLQHGIFRYYDQEGNVTLEYEYKNGEKVSGGIVGK